MIVYEKLKKIHLIDAEFLNDSEMKELKGASGSSGNGCPTTVGSFGECWSAGSCFAFGQPGRCRIILFSYGSIPYAQLGYTCACDTTTTT